MASLWNKLSFSSKTNLPADNEEASSKRTRKQSLSARSRKSLALIFPSVYGDPSTDKENASAANPDLNCKEAANYPVYDPKNPEHNTACQSPLKRNHRSRSWSPLKESLRSKSPSPTRLMTSSRKALSEFTNSVKAKTAAVIGPSTPPALLREVSPMGRDSDKSVMSKKSVRWRSSDSTALVTRNDGKSSPKDIISPVIPDINFSDHFLGSQLALTARPPPTPILTALEQVDRKPHSIELQRPVLTEIAQPPLLTPMPGTNLPLEDPFDDKAAIAENEINIFKDPDCASEHDGESAQIPTLEVLVGIAPSSIATVAASECLEQSPMPRASSKMYDGDTDSSTSEDTDALINAVSRVNPKPPNVRGVRDSSIEDLTIDKLTQELQEELPKIKVSGPDEYEPPKGHLGVLQAMSEAASAVSLGSALDDSDKENQSHEHSQKLPSVQQDMDCEHAKCGQGCRVSSLSEPVKHDILPPNSPSQQPPIAQLTTARRLPPFHLHANVTSTSPPRDTPAFRFTNSSDESMSIVDETEYSWEVRKVGLYVREERARTPSPANVPLPETPMPGSF